MGEPRTEYVETPDGAFQALVMLPDQLPAPGVLVLQEIFGVNAYIVDICDRLASAGYVAMAPDVFWRTEVGVAINDYDEASIARAMKFGSGLNFERSVDDLVSAMSHLRAMQETTGRIGLLGFCLGGTLAYFLAARADPDVCVSYYGSGVPGALNALDNVSCPIVFQFGANDPVIPVERLQPLLEAAARRSDIEVRLAAGAGHGYANHRNPALFQKDAATAAWRLTIESLRTYLGG